MIWSEDSEGVRTTNSYEVADKLAMVTGSVQNAWAHPYDEVSVFWD